MQSELVIHNEKEQTMKKQMLFTFALVAMIGQAEIMINEIMADNGGSYPNVAGEAMDWLELYNPGATPVDLTGWRITDTVEDEWAKWKEIPAGTTVPAGGYLLLWGHNKDFPTPEDKKGFCGVTNGEVHVKLGMSSKGETIALAASEADYNVTNFADQVTFGAQFADVSYGRDPNDTAKWLFFTNATPGAANGTDGLEKYPPDVKPGEGDDPGPHPQEENTELEERLLDLGLSLVVIDTVDQEEPAYEFADPPAGCWGAGIKNATKVPGRLRVKTTAGVAYDSGEYVKKTSGMTLKIRGNTSARAEKKPYKIKLQKENDLLLRGDDGKYADAEWVLLASANSLNNVIGFAINDLVGFSWTPSYRFVNLVVNGTYRGVYLLCEGENRNQKCRIDVADDGFLFEMDAYWWNEDVYFKTPFCERPVGYTFKYPDSDDITVEQVCAVSNAMALAEDSITDGSYDMHIDVRSFAAWLLGHDILGTSDSGGSNIYFTKYDCSSETPIQMANLWDFDTICRRTDQWAKIHLDSWSHFSKLCASENLAFNDTYRLLWLRLRHGLCGKVSDVLDGMESGGLAQSLEKSWSLESSALGRTYRSFTALRQSMEAWFSDRVKWIDAHIDEMPHNPDPPVTVTEIMADNCGALLTADGKAEDWIELYNPGATDVDISGWRLCDSTTKKWSKWEELPEGTVVPAGGYLIVWADDFTGWTNGEVHVNLGFSSKGEEVALAIAEGEIVSSFAFGPQHTDISFGRDPSDLEKLVYFKNPTPGAANGNDGIENGDSFNISINELMAENGGKFPNAAGEAMDWVELYNAGETDVNVSGWGFQDDPTKAWSKWKTLPEGAVVPAGGYLLVWGDNKDFNSFTGITNGEVHVNMGLSKKGEGLHFALTNGVGTVVKIDGFDFPKQAPDVSWGRTASDSDKFLYFTEPTPAAANGDAGREALVFTIDFDANGGSVVASETNEYDEVISAPESMRTGYTFAGWYETDAADPFAFSTMPARDVALTARWTANEYTVDFNPGQDGEGTMFDQPMVYDEEEALYSNVFCRTGYVFLGWTDDERELAEVMYSDGVVVSNLTGEADGEYDLYAVWAANEYTVTFDANGGYGTMEDQLFLYDEQQPLASNAFVKANYLFAGWIAAGGRDSPVYADGEAVSNLTAEADGVVTLCAQWKLDGWEAISGAKVAIETGLSGYKASGLPKGLTYSKATGKITGTATMTGEFLVTFTKDGERPWEKMIVVRAEKVSIGCEGLAAGPLPAGVGTAGGIDIQIGNEGGTKSVSVTKLPAGMKYDSASGKITGAPSKAGDYEVVLTMTTKYGTKETVKIPVSVTAMPETAVGTFNGFVSVNNDTHGTFTLTTTAAGRLTAKAVTAAGTVAFSGTSWDSVEKGVYRAMLTTKKGEKLALALDSTAAWDSNQLSGEFTKSAGDTYSVSAQRNAFGKTWYFSATGDAKTGWTFSYAKDAKAAVFTVTLKADGSTSISGKLPNGKDAKGKNVTVKVSASGSANVGGLRDGAVLADFAPALTVGGKKKTLAIRINLWFDRKNDHELGVGEAKFAE